MHSMSLRLSPHGRGRGVAAFVCALVIVGSAAQPAFAEIQPSVRQGWLLGLGVGGGGAKVTVPGGSSDRESGPAASVRVGYAFDPRLSLELDGTGWTREQSGTRIIFSVWAPTLNYYPGQQGLVLRAGVGWGSGEALEQSGNVTISTRESGLGVLAGVGYEFRVTRRFALGPQIHGGWMDLDSFNANWATFDLGFHWYFVPK